MTKPARRLDDSDRDSLLDVPPPDLIDTSFDVRTDANGKDPDSHSATLRAYHRLLWSKPLPGGEVFDLDDRLHHSSGLGEFWLASDAITHTYSNWTRPAQLVESLQQTPREDIAAFYDLGCTVGAYTVFPAQVHAAGKWRMSINQARGMHPKIRDRFDLTLECIRRHYEGSANPMATSLAWYAPFFDLFGDFPGYVDHFLLNDLVTSDYSTVEFFIDFDEFQRSALPLSSADEYRDYMQGSMNFIRARNERIERYEFPSGGDPT